MLTLIHNNPVELNGTSLRVDRKFHTGMLNYVNQIKKEIVTVNPLVGKTQSIMDDIVVPLKDLPYRVVGITLDPHGQ